MDLSAAITVAAFAVSLGCFVSARGVRTARERLFALLSAIFLALFSALAVVRGMPFARSIDESVFEYFFKMYDMGGPATLAIAYVAEGALVFVTVISLVTVAVHSIRGRVSSVLLIAFAAGMAFFEKLILKSGLEVARPAVFLGDASGWSFPSGHVLLASSLATVLVVIIRGSRLRRLIMAFLLAAAVIAISLGRVALGDHWLSDVVAGGSLGIGLAAWCALVLESIARSWDECERSSV